MLGLATASVWTPWLLNTWRQRSHKLLYEWGQRNTENANELKASNPKYDPEYDSSSWCRSEKDSTNCGPNSCGRLKWWLLTLRALVVVVFALALVFMMSFVLITVDNALVTTPVCDSFFDEQVPFQPHCFTTF